jgi:Domain of unknown function (DUF4136)
MRRSQIIRSRFRDGDVIGGIMRSITWLLLASAAAAFACSGIRVTTDYDPNADFSNVRSYAWFEETSGVQGDRADVTSLLDRRVRSAVDGELQRKGIARVDKSTAKILVGYHLGVETKLDVDTINSGYGYGRYGYYGGISTQTTVREYQEGTLLIDVIDPSSKQLVWRGSGQARIRQNSTPEEREKRIGEAVKEILESFPPRAKGG